MKFIDRIKRMIKSIRFSKDEIIPGLVLVGVYKDRIDADVIIEDADWKNSIGSYMMKIEQVRDNQVGYYHWYISRTGRRHLLTNSIILISKEELCRLINRLHLFHHRNEVIDNFDTD